MIIAGLYIGSSDAWAVTYNCTGSTCLNSNKTPPPPTNTATSTKTSTTSTENTSTGNSKKGIGQSCLQKCKATSKGRGDSKYCGRKCGIF